jgi:Rrf2 family protein
MGPFNISVKGEYALLALFDLAMQRPGEPVKISAIAKRQNMPQKFLELILATLKQGGFVDSRRGADGGYLLTRSAESITVGEILRYIDGRGTRSARKRDESPFYAVWNKAETAASCVLDHASIADTVRAWKEKNMQYVPNWEI